MEYNELLEKYRLLLAENINLKEEIKSLKARLDTREQQTVHSEFPGQDTLFLVAPVSWKGTWQQYVGRLHRLFENKKEVQVYDYVDVRIRLLARMYHKRLAGYAATGYKVKGEPVPGEAFDFIFNVHDFLPVYSHDIENAAREIWIISPYVTRPVDVFKDEDKTALQLSLDAMRTAGVKIVLRAQIHQKFAVSDQRIVWYGSINLLRSFGKAEASSMRLESPHVAGELLRIIDK